MFSKIGRPNLVDEVMLQKVEDIIISTQLAVSLIKRNPAGSYMFKVNNRNTRTRYEICSKLTIKTPNVFIVNFGHISRLVLVFLLLTLSRYMPVRKGEGYVWQTT